MKRSLFLLATVLILFAPVLSCKPALIPVSPETTGPAPQTTVRETPTPPVTPATTVPEPSLSSTLTRNCPVGPTRAQAFEDAGLGPGQKAVNFTLLDTQGVEYRLSRLLAEKPVVMIFGSFT